MTGEWNGSGDRRGNQALRPGLGRLISLSSQGLEWQFPELRTRVSLWTVQAEPFLQEAAGRDILPLFPPPT